MEIRCKIRGIDCANCAAELERKIQKLEGIEDASISFMTEKLTIELDENREDEIMDAVRKLVKKEEPDAEIEEI